MKRIFALIIAFAMTVALAGCFGRSESRVTEQEIPNVITSSDDVTINVPASFFEGRSMEEIIEEALEEGIVVTFNEDGTVSYTMSGSYHNEMMEEIRDEVLATFAEMLEGEVWNDIVKDIRANDDFTSITVEVDRANFENNMFAAMLNFVLGMQARVYNVFRGNLDAEITVDIVDAITGEIISTTVYPE